MCGITGFLDTAASPSSSAQDLGNMVRALSHRGPDDQGTWSDEDVGVYLGHRRLAILDPTPDGHQPMESHNGRWVISYNGELYNFRALRKELEAQGRTFRTRSDTEVLLEAVDAWGVAGALERFNAMFAFALWDKRERILHLARDRFGEKPLYYGRVGTAAAFASELKGLRAHSKFANEIDPDVLALYMEHNCVPAPYSIHHDIHQLLPGTHVEIWPGAAPSKPVAYWSAARVAEASRTQSVAIGEKEATDSLEKLLKDAVKLRLESDVPLGAFLSGGIDSSTIVALMQANTVAPIRTFTIGFEEAAYDEAAQARAVAEHLGTDHTEQYVAPKQAQAVIKDLATIYDEPFADASQIPTILLARLARRHVKVALSGDGGDELFGGYNRYVWGAAAFRRSRGWPAGVRRGAARAISRVAPRSWDRIFRGLGPVVPKKYRARMPGEKLHKYADALRAETVEEAYRAWATHWRDPRGLVPRSRPLATHLTQPSTWPRLEGDVHRMMYLDTVTYLPDDILTKVDRACMSVGLEARVPFLDPRVYEFAWGLPDDVKIRHGVGKWILRRVLDRHVPTRLIERPKMGFGVPIESWLRGPLRDWADSLLEPARLKDAGWIDAKAVQEKWRQHLAGTHNWQYYLWDVLMFQNWLENQPTQRPRPSDAAPIVRSKVA